MSPSRWTVADMPSQAGRTAVVTGASSGIGLVTARERARAGFGEIRGHPRPVGSSVASHDRDVQRSLWERSETLTGVRFDVAPAPSG